MPQPLILACYISPLFRRRKTGYLGGSLTHALLLSLNSADATHFYDLPSLENTLHALVHVTARYDIMISAVESLCILIGQNVITW